MVPVSEHSGSKPEECLVSETPNQSLALILLFLFQSLCPLFLQEPCEAMGTQGKPRWGSGREYRTFPGPCSGPFDHQLCGTATVADAEAVLPDPSVPW